MRWAVMNVQEARKYAGGYEKCIFAPNPTQLKKNYAMRSKVIAASLISLFFMKTVRSQSDELIVQGQTGHLYLQHTVVAKENWYSIGRLYNLSPTVLAPYNKLAMTQPLSIGQQLQIPLTAVNFSQNGQKAAGESLVPLYHVIQEKEWMYRISVNHNRVPITSLEKWNNINKDQVRAGMHIIVGYLKVKTALSAFANKAGGTPVVTGTPGSVKPVANADAGLPAGVAPAEKTATSGVPPTGNAGDVAKPATSASGDKQVNGAAKPAGDVAKSGTSAPVDGGVKPVTSMTKPVDGGVKPGTGATKPGDDGVKPVTSMTKPVDGGVKPGAGATKAVDGAVKPATNATTDKPAGSVEKPVSPSGKSFNGGFFKADFTDGGKSVEGAAGTFKSSSGWQDGKYYALMNNVPVGTIVRITVGSSGKSVYAKVLGQLPDMKESAGMTIRISNAAAGELGEGEGRFNVTVRY
jgi:hypothetical protein